MVSERSGADQQDAPEPNLAGVANLRGRIYVFDLDHTLCHIEGLDYAAAVPYRIRIAYVNALYDRGATILIDSARGSGTGDDWQARTEQQLRAWGLRYHQVRTGVKFFGHVYVDDRAQSDREFFAHVETH